MRLPLLDKFRTLDWSKIKEELKLNSIFLPPQQLSPQAVYDVL